jgi:hypothetical protein
MLERIVATGSLVLREVLDGCEHGSPLRRLGA